MKAIRNFLFLAPSSHTLPLHPCRHRLFMYPPPFSPWLLILFMFINHTVHSHQKVTAGCMNGVSWPQRLPCITDALTSGWTPGSARKHARNARNGPVSDKKEIPRSRLDFEAQKQQAHGQSLGRNERDDDKEWDGKGWNRMPGQTYVVLGW